MSLLVLRARPVADCVSETSAAATARPLESCTVPEIESVTICANKPSESSKNNKDSCAIWRNDMGSSPKPYHRARRRCYYMAPEISPLLFGSPAFHPTMLPL